VAADYEMDPDIVDNPAYSSSIIDDLKSIPTMSLVMNVDAWFGNGSTGTNGVKGIYTNPTARDADNATTLLWERCVSVELINPDGTRGFQMDGGISTHGGQSRVPTKTPKHSFMLSFKNRYEGDLSFPVFGGDAADTFEDLVLRGNYNNTWEHWDSAQRTRAQYVHDQWMSDSQLAMGDAGSHSKPVHLYINGLYWGLYFLTERPAATFAASYFGGQEEDYDTIKVSDDGGMTATDGNMTAYNAMFTIANAGLASDAQYQAVQQYLNIPAFIDYMILNFYAGNNDWDQHNWYAGRSMLPPVYPPSSYRSSRATQPMLFWLAT
jgi:hypothetical protein